MTTCLKSSLARSMSACVLALACSGTIAYAASCVVNPAAAPAPLDPALRRTVVITAATDAAVLGGADFSLGRTLGNIIKTAPGMADSQAERVALLTTMIRSLRATSRVNPDSGVTFPVPARAEASLDPIALLDPANPNGMKVVGLFNRYDLAPADFKTCGEHRIVYAKNSTSPTDRFLLIFEAALDNPRPDLGAEGCRPIAKFWDDLKTATPAAAAASLSKFYYDGLAPGIEAVVHFTNYGIPFGQVRANLFKQSPWQLREWRISLAVDGAPVFTPVTVKTNPFPGLYAAPAAGENAGIAALRPPFQAEFVGTRLGELVAVDQGGIVSNPEQAADLFFQLGAAFPNRFNGFESTAQGNSQDPEAIAVADLKTKITQRLNQTGIGSACELKQEHVLNRAGALSCGGCHQFTVGKPVATGVKLARLRGLRPYYRNGRRFACAGAIFPAGAPTQPCASSAGPDGFRGAACAPARRRSDRGARHSPEAIGRSGRGKPHQRDQHPVRRREADPGGPCSRTSHTGRLRPASQAALTGTPRLRGAAAEPTCSCSVVGQEHCHAERDLPSHSSGDRERAPDHLHLSRPLSRTVPAYPRPDRRQGSPSCVAVRRSHELCAPAWRRVALPHGRRHPRRRAA